MENDDRQVEKRERSVNFTSIEVRLLTEIVAKFHDVIESRKNNKAKEAAWVKIGRLFNSASDATIRSPKTLKLKYEGIKKKTKTKIARNSQELLKTGSREASQDSFSSTEKKLLGMCSVLDVLESKNKNDTVIASSSPLSIVDVKDETSETIVIKNEVLNSDSDSEPTVSNFANGGDTQNNKSTSDTEWQSWTQQKPTNINNPALRKKLTKTSARTNLEKLSKARLGLVDIQKKIAEKELKNKQIEHELIVQHKSEEHAIRILYLQNEERRRQEEHDLRMRDLNK